MPAHTCTGYDGRPDVTWVQDGWIDEAYGTHGFTRIPRMGFIKTQWLPIPCGHTTRATDPDCQHCPRAKE